MTNHRTTPKFSAQVRERAVRMVLEHRGEHASQWAAVVSIAAKIGCTAQTLSEWVIKAAVDGGRRPGVTTDLGFKLLDRQLRDDEAVPGRCQLDVLRNDEPLQLGNIVGELIGRERHWPAVVGRWVFWLWAQKTWVTLLGAGTLATKLFVLPALDRWRYARKLAAHTGALAVFRCDRRQLWSTERYGAGDQLFTRLSLLLDKGEEEVDERWEKSKSTYDSLADVLNKNLDEQAFVLLGAPGAGKSTLLRRLDVECADARWPEVD